MSVFRRAVAFVLSGLMAAGQPAEVLAASYVFRQPTSAGTFPIPVITNNVVNSTTYYKVDGRTYSLSWQGTGGRGPYLIQMVGAPLPPGCAVPVQTGSILSTTCTFNQEGNYSGIIAQLTDQNGMVVRDNALPIVVSAPAPTLSTYSFPFSGSVGIPYSGTLRVNGGRAPFTPSRATGDLPPGLSLSMVQDAMTGAWSVRLAGTPTAPGSYTFDILVTDFNQKQVTSSRINISVAYGPVSLSLRPSTQAGIYRGVADKPMPDAGVTVVGGTPPVNLSLAAGAMPPGLSLGPDGALVGSPTTPGTYSGIQIRAVDSASSPRNATSAAFQVVVANALTAMLQGGNDAYVRNRPISPVSTVATGGTAPYRYALTGGSLPPGVTFSTTTGQFSGTPTQAGRYEGLTVTVTDAGGFSTAAAPFAMVVADPLAIAGTVPRGVAGSAYATSFTASGGTPPYSFSLMQGDLPFGLDLAEDGTLSGTPFLPGSSDGLVVRVTDANGSAMDTAPFSIEVADALTVAETPAGTATRGTAYASAFTAAGGTPPYAFALVSGRLPPGLSLTSGGAVTGTPTTAGTFGPFTVRLTDGDGTSATADASIAVSEPLAVAGSAGRGMVGATYVATYAASGGTAPYGFDLSGSPLPGGLTLSVDGGISGTPSATGTFPGIVVEVTDADGRQVRTSPFSIVIDAPLRIAGDPSASATMGQAYSATFAASGGAAPYTFSLASGTLPTGLSLQASSGVIAGTASDAGVSNGLTIRVADSAGRTATSPVFSIAVSAALTVAGTATTSATVGEPYSAGFTASGGATPYVWSLASGTLPPGISLDASNGTVSGTASTTGSYPGIQLRVADADGRSALSSIFGISVGSSLAITGTPANFGTVGQPYSAQFASTGGTGTKAFSLATGQLPDGLSFDTTTGLISGTPTAAGFSPAIAVRVRDASNSAATAPAFDLRVSDPLAVTGAPIPDATVGEDYSGFATLTGGRGPFAWTLAAGTLPQGLSLAPSTGVVGGRPSTAGTISGLQLRVVDADGRTGITAPFSIAVSAALTIAGAAGPATVGDAYSAHFAASGGKAPHIFAVLGSALPAGLMLDASTGRISGTPTVAAPAGTTQIQVTDAAGRSATSAAFGIDVRDPLRLVATNLESATLGLAYTGAMSPVGGRGPYSLNLSSGSLPPGLSLSATTGALTGTPTQAGSFPGIVVRATDADGRIAVSESFAIEVAPGLIVTGMPPQPATVGVPYAYAFAGSGGSTPYIWSLSGGALPVGLTIDPSTGSLGGIPTRVGTVSGLAAVVRDNASRTGSSQTFTIDVRDPVVVTGDPGAVALTGQNYSAAFTTAGGRGPFAYSMVGTLPAGLTLSAASGTISGTPTATGDVAGLQVRAVDQDGRTGISSSFSIFVVHPLTLAGVPAGTADVGAAYDAKFTAAGGRLPYVYELAAGTLPAGLRLDGSTGEIAGVPSANGAASGLQIRVRDANGTTTLSQVFAIVVADPLSAAVEAGPATVGGTYAGSVLATGGRGPFVFTMAAGALPAGLQVDGASGRITGTPRSSGTSAGLQVRVADADGRVATTPVFTIVVSLPLSLVGSGLPAQTATVGLVYDSSVSATGGDAPYAYTLSAGTLPNGLTLDAGSGRISGIPTNTGLAEGLQITVADVHGRIVRSGPFRIDVRDPVVVAGDPPGFGTTGIAYGPAAFAAAGGRGPYTFAMVGTLPNGLSLNSSSGVIAGTPTRAGSFTDLQVRASDMDGRTGYSRPFSIDVTANLSISASMPSSATVGMAYAGGYAAQNGRAPYAFSLVAGNLPGGLSLDPSTGQIVGTPSAVGSHQGIQVRVTDRDGRVATSATMAINVAEPLHAEAAPSPAVRSVAYTTSIAVSGGRAPFTYSLVGGTLPAGLGLGATTGTISGTPTTVQVAGGLQIRVVDADGRSATTQPFAISVAASLSLSLTSTIQATIGSNAAFAATANGGRPPYAFALASGAFPVGVQIDGGTGSISGLPAATGSYPFTIAVTDIDGRSATAASTMIVADAVVVDLPAMTDGMLGTNFAASVRARGGSGRYTFTVAGGSLPHGLTLNSSTGDITGTPTNPGSYAGIQIRATDAGGRQALSTAYNITIDSRLALSGTFGTAARGTTYLANFVASGGRAPYRYEIASGTLPGGLGLDPLTGAISGTPTAAGTFGGIQVRAIDSLGRLATSAAASITVLEPLAISGASNRTSVVAQNFSMAFTASGGRPGYTYALASGTLPTGLSLGSGGTIGGRTQTRGTWSGISIRVADADGRTATSGAFSIVVADPLSVSVMSQPGIVLAGQPYSATLGAAGGVGPYTFSVASGNLPQGLSLNASGSTATVSGTPTVGGVSSVILAVLDGAGQSARASLAVSVGAATGTGLTIHGVYPILTKGGQPYQGKVFATGGAPPYRWFLAPGQALQPGLSLNPSTGEISGVPSVPGNTWRSVKVFVTDSVGAGQMTDFRVNNTVFAPTFAGRDNYCPNHGVIGRDVACDGRVIGGQAPYVFEGTGLPDGLSVVTTGPDSYVLIGRPTRTGRFSVTVKATDQYGSTAFETTTFAVIEEATTGYVMPSKIGVSRRGYVRAPTADYASILLRTDNVSSLSMHPRFSLNSNDVVRYAGDSMIFEFNEPIRMNMLTGSTIGGVPWSGGVQNQTVRYSLYVGTPGSNDYRYVASSQLQGSKITFPDTVAQKFMIQLDTNLTQDNPAAFMIGWDIDKIWAPVKTLPYPVYISSQGDAGVFAYNNISPCCVVGTQIYIPTPQIQRGSSFSLLLPPPQEPTWWFDDRLTLPPGLTFDAATGRVSGTLTTRGSTGEIHVYGAMPGGYTVQPRSAHRHFEVR